MSSVRWQRTAALALTAVVGAAPVSALAVDPIARCAAIDAPDARLTCYDRVAGRGVAPAAGSTTAAPAAAAPGAPGPAVPTGGAQAFGLTPAHRNDVITEPPSVDAVIASAGAAGSGKSTIRLDNGQTWLVLDTDERLGAGDKVSIRRAALGSFMMTTAARHSYKVRRLN